MYVEANPIRAGLRKFENLKLYKFNSFAFYAFGEIDKDHPPLTPPDWYVNLGHDLASRQKKYRSLFKAYLSISDSQKRPLGTISLFFGELSWAQRELAKIRESLKLMASNTLTEPKPYLRTPSN